MCVSSGKRAKTPDRRPLCGKKPRFAKSEAGLLLSAPADRERRARSLPDLMDTEDLAGELDATVARFRSGIVQRAIGIPVSLFTAIFALARTVGWMAQLNEMIGDPEYKIGRPRQLFVGQTPRNVKPIGQRG